MNINAIYTIENEIRIYRNLRTGEEFREQGWDSRASIQAWEIAKATGDEFHITTVNAITGEILRERDMAA